MLFQAFPCPSIPSFQQRRDGSAPMHDAGVLRFPVSRANQVCGECRVECCIRCLAQGVAATHIIDGRQQHSLLMELLTDTGVGTMIVG